MIVRLDAEGNLPDCDVFWSNEQHMPAAAYSPGRDVGAVVSMDINYPTTFYEERAEVERNAWSLIPQPLETITRCRSVR